MEDSNKSTGIIIGVIVAVLVAAGVFWALNMNNDDDEASTENTSQQTEQQPQEQTDDIVGLAAGSPTLSTLVTAVQAAELVETLQGEGPFTVFAPTNEAFEALPAGTLDSLLEPANKEQLQAVLTYHVVSGNVLAGTLTDGQEITTVQGGTLTVRISGGSVYLVDATGGEAMVQAADIEASNGTVHIIDSVLLPQ